MTLSDREGAYSGTKSSDREKARRKAADRAEEKGHRGSRDLRALLVATDLGVAAVAWISVLALAHPGDWKWYLTKATPFAVVMAGVTFSLAWSQKLYQARVCALRSSEVVRLSRVAIIGGVFAFGLGRWHHTLQPWVVAAAAGVTFAMTAASRAVYTSWLRRSRVRGHFARRVCVIGTNDEAEDLVYLLRDHPELGYSVAAVIGDSQEWASRIRDVQVQSMGPDPVETVRSTGASGVVVAASALSHTRRDWLIGRLVADGLHVQLSAGLTRLGHNRLRVSPLAHQLAFYVEPPQLSGGQAAVKRSLDILVASMILLATAPLAAAAAVMIKLEDGGPVLYRQERVGLKGRTFQVLKLRTMVPDASSQLEELERLNEREGPLFKLATDPRVTRIGRFLRTASIDELPQLVNVLKGEMSMVGPRPALPSEFAQFDEDLAERAQVLPGITGLWQVEARDNPSFRAYRRLDLFYVDNWSIGFDLAIMAGTAQMLVGRTLSAALSALFPRRHRQLGPGDHEVPELEASSA